VDPSRSALISQVDAQVSGRDPKPFDAGLTPAAHLYLLEINRPFESWVVLGRTGGEFDEIRFEELGLDAAKSFLVFEFWQRKLQGSFTKAFAPGALPAKYNSQIFIIRERQDHPQVIATSRHITGGGVDLNDVSWKDGVLSGRSQVVGGDPYQIYITEPAGWTFAELQVDGGNVLPAVREGELIKTGFLPGKSAETTWRARFQRGTVTSVPLPITQLRERGHR
jgi:hypothetical protein